MPASTALNKLNGVEELEPTPAERDTARRVGAFTSAKHRRRYVLLVTALIAAAILVTALTFSWNNPYEIFSDKWWRISRMRSTSLLVIALVTLCQSFATVTFQTVTNNRILTPSIMGFESLYILLQTATVYFFGVSGLLRFDDLSQFLMQVGAMVLFAVLLYSWLFSGKLGNLHIMLLVGIIIGTGLGSLSTFMQRMIDPNEFDVLTARLFGNVGNANTDFLSIVIPVCLIAAGLIWVLAGRLNVISLGSDASTNLGMNYKRQVMLMLTLVSILMAMSTSLVGPMTFLGFLIATLAYSVTDTYDHRRVLPVAWLLGFVVLGGAYFLLRHVLPMVDTVTLIVELIGGLVFLIVILRKGRL